MSLVLTEDQQLLEDSAREWVAAEAPITRFRAMRDAGATHDPELWTQLVELGWPAIAIGEDQGGLGMGLAGLAVVMESLGRQLVSTPLLSSHVGHLLAPRDAHASGAITALAWQEPGRGFARVPRLTRALDGRLRGHKLAVLDAESADQIVVSALDARGESALYLVSPSDVTLRPLVRIDHRSAADIDLADAPATRLDASQPELERALDEATIALTAEMLGSMTAANEITIAYLKEREQFGKPIGAFQALQHRMVDCFVAAELARSAVLAAARDPGPRLASLAKCRCNEAFMRIANEMIQLHGGIGMTDEHDAGFFLKRARVASWTLGTTAWHRDRWATLSGY